MNVVDSSAWLEYFANGPNASFIARSIEKTEDLVVPTISLYEVFKRILQQRDEESALQGIAVIQQGQIVDLEPSLAITALNGSSGVVVREGIGRRPPAGSGPRLDPLD